MDNLNAKEKQIEEESTAYRVVLENFEGPLDLLLQIIKDNKMDIETVKLASLTDQYLEYISGIEKLDMDNASEFIDIAAQLIEIKSRTLLPPDEEEEISDDDVKLLDARNRGLEIKFKTNIITCFTNPTIKFLIELKVLELFSVFSIFLNIEYSNFNNSIYIYVNIYMLFNNVFFALTN